MDLSPEALKRHALLMQMAPEGAPAPAQESGEGPRGIGAGPYAALLGGQGADIGTTIAALKNPRLKEGNPLGLGGVLASKAAMLTLAPWLMRRMTKAGHPTAAKVMGYGVGAAGAVPAALNLRTMAKAR